MGSGWLGRSALATDHPRRDAGEGRKRLSQGGRYVWDHQPDNTHRSATDVGSHRLPLLWTGFMVASLLALDVLDVVTWSIAVPVAAGALGLDYRMGAVASHHPP